MKSLRCILAALFAISAIVFAPNVSAATQKLELINAEIINKSNTVTVDDIIFDANTITSNITFGKEGDALNINLRLKNISDEKLKITNISSNENENLAIEYTYTGEPVAQEDIVDINAKITYVQKAINVDKISFDDIQITIELTKEDESKELFTINPYTHDGIKNYIIAAVILLSAILLIIAISKKKYAKRIAVIAAAIYAAILPITAIAIEEQTATVKFANIDIIGEFETYQISFDPDNGNEDEIKDVRYGDKIGDLPPAPSKDGYNFDGWTDGEGNEITPDTEITSPINIKAKYSPINYDIIYALNGGDVTGNPNSYNIETESFTLNNPQKDYYNFIGWTNEDIANPQKLVSINKGSTGSRNYTANYAPIDYEITYELNGGIVSQNPIIYNVETESFTLNNPQKDYYNFIGWTNEENSEPQIQVTIAKGSAGSKKFTANYAPTDFDITYNLNGGTISGNPDKYNIETDTFTLNNPEKEHYNFVGWTEGDNSEPQQNITINTGTTGAKYFTAIFEPKLYNIVFNANGGSMNNEEASREIKYGSEIGDLPSATKDDYGFAGWYTEREGGEKINKNTVVRGQAEYYAHWLDNSTLATNIIAQKVNPTYGINFSQSAAISDDPVKRNGNGVNKYTENGKDIYYYRGQIYDNNVIWADKCWKIIRTTSTGGTKVIYNGPVTNVEENGEISQQCLAMGEDTTISQGTPDSEDYRKTIEFNDGDGCSVSGRCTPAYLGYMYGNADPIYEYKANESYTYIFSDSITVNDGKSTLNTTSGHFKKGVWNEDLRLQILDNYHYFCPSKNTSTCNNADMKYMFYIYSASSPNKTTTYSLSLKGRTNVDQLLEEMKINQNDSIAKQAIDTWYEQNLMDKSDDLEDTVFCNDRSFAQGALSPAHTNMRSYNYTTAIRRLQFESTITPTLECAKNDAFTTDEANGNGALKYKIGMISGDEAVLAGSKGTIIASQEPYLYSNTNYWTMTPYGMLGVTPYQIAIEGSGLTWDYIRDNNSQTVIGVRPVVSLKAGIRFISGTGTKEDPYRTE